MISLTSLADSAEIVCEWSGDICGVSSMTPVTQPNEAITIAGKPANYLNVATYEFSTFFKSGFNFNYFPTRILYIFPYLNRIKMSSSSAKTTLETNSIVNCEFLADLIISNINISNIPEGFAQACINLYNLQFFNAGIETIHKNAFKGLTNLEILMISKNKITCLPLDLFQLTPNLELIALENNKISAIDSGLFRSLPKVRLIDLSYNLINYLPTLNFPRSCIQYPIFGFLLTGNPIYAIKPDFCNTFNTRPDVAFDFHTAYPPRSNASIVAQISCLSSNETPAGIRKSNCQGAMAIPLQKCYSNWTSSMNSPVTCEPPCQWASIWQQILDFLKIKF